MVLIVFLNLFMFNNKLPHFDEGGKIRTRKIKR